MPLIIEIPLPTPSLNKLQRMHFHARTRLRRQYETICHFQATGANRAKRFEFRRVSITRHSPRELDFDNLVGGCKLLVDALERTGLIYCDAPQYLRVEYNQRKATASKARTVVVVT